MNMVCGGIVGVGLLFYLGIWGLGMGLNKEMEGFEESVWRKWRGNELGWL